MVAFKSLSLRLTPQFEHSYPYHCTCQGCYVRVNACSSSDEPCTFGVHVLAVSYWLTFAGCLQGRIDDSLAANRVEGVQERTLIGRGVWAIDYTALELAACSRQLQTQ